MSDVTVLAVRPHPDDEVTGTGGIIARYTGQGVRVGVLTCTLGEEGEINDPDLNPEEIRPGLGEIREQELRAACQVLGVGEILLLGYRDSGMAGTPANRHPLAFCNASLDEAGGRVAAVIRQLRPRVVITENSQGTYGHPDHIMCHKATVRGVELAADPSYAADGLEPWPVDRLYATEIARDGAARLAAMLREEGLDMGWFEDAGEMPFGITAAEADAVVDVSPYVPAVRAALAKHRTQIAPDNFLLTWPDRVMRQVFGTAYFRQLHPAPGGRHQQDLLEGLSPA